MTYKLINLVKPAMLAFLLTFALSAMAQDGTIYPLEAPAEPNAIPLGTGGVENQPARESWFRQWGDPMARNVSTATLTPFLPEKGKANGAAVIVAPGGGFRWLSMGNEGWEVAQALADKGIAAFVLKYRLQPTPESIDGFKESMERTFAAAADTSSRAPKSAPGWDLSNQVADAEAAYALIVKRAAEWGVDTSRLGMIGFSAGGHLVALLGTSGDVKELEGDVGGNLKYSSRVKAVADFCGFEQLPNCQPILVDCFQFIQSLLSLFK